MASGGGGGGGGGSNNDSPGGGGGGGRGSPTHIQFHSDGTFTELAWSDSSSGWVQTDRPFATDGSRLYRRADSAPPTPPDPANNRRTIRASEPGNKPRATDPTAPDTNPNMPEEGGGGGGGGGGSTRTSSPYNEQPPTSARGTILPILWGRFRNFTPRVIAYSPATPIYEDRIVDGSPSPNAVASWVVLDETNSPVVYERIVVAFKNVIQLGLCRGPDVILKGMYFEKFPLWEGTTTTAREVVDLDYTGTAVGSQIIFSNGSFTQAPDPYLEELVVTPVPGYRGVSHIILPEYHASLGMGSMSFEIARYPDPLGLSSINKIGDDLNPVSVIADVISSAWNGIGLNLGNSVDLSMFADAAQRLYDEGNGVSMLVPGEMRPTDIIKPILSQIKGKLYSNPRTNKLELKLIRRELYDVPALPNFNPSNVQKVKGFNKPSWFSIPNYIRGTYTDRRKGYFQSAVIADNLAQVSSFGLNDASFTIPYPNVLEGDLAAKLLARDMADYSYPLISMAVETNRDGAYLLPGDGVTITFPRYELEDKLLIVESRRDGTPDRSVQIVTLRELSEAVHANVTAAPENTLHEPTSFAPLPPAYLEIVEMPAYFVTRYRYTTGLGIPNWQIGDGYEAPLVLFDGNTSILNGTYVRSPNGGTATLDTFGVDVVPSGFLADNIGQFDGIEDGYIDELTIELISVIRDHWLMTPTEDQIRQGVPLLLINGEFFVYEDLHDNGDGSVTFYHVWRGMIDTAPKAHAADDLAYILTGVRMNANKWVDHSTEWDIRVTAKGLYQNVKFSDIVAPQSDLILTFDWEVARRATKPLRPHNTKIDGVRSATPVNLVKGDDADITWSTRSRMQFYVAKNQTDDPDTPETDGVTQQVHRVLIRDANNDVYDCGTVEGADAKTITVPAGAVVGNGVLYVQAEHAGRTSSEYDEVPINLSNP